MNERQLLSTMRHPFLVNMIYAFQDRENLYLVMDLMTGGDLRFHLNKQKKFTEQQTKFFIASIIHGLEFLHVQGIIHRDIKPENLVFDAKGYLRITDLGIARIWRPDNSADTSGTPGYMAPEVMCRQNHGVAVDYYALGVIAHECMLGKRPYIGKSRKEIRDQILAKQAQIKKAEIPEDWSLEAADFINKLLQRKPINRLGLNGPQEVKEHPWLKDFPWQKLTDKELESPFMPNSKEDNFDLKYVSSHDPSKDCDSEVMKQNALLLRRDSIQSLFHGYDFDGSKSASTSTANMSSMQNNSHNITIENSSSKNEKLDVLSRANSNLSSASPAPSNPNIPVPASQSCIQTSLAIQRSNSPLEEYEQSQNFSKRREFQAQINSQSSFKKIDETPAYQELIQFFNYCLYQIVQCYGFSLLYGFTFFYSFLLFSSSVICCCVSLRTDLRLEALQPLLVLFCVFTFSL
eukprot:TRINITY_DN2268_c0_g1_i1.p1 TRINITY_DN2268_c0_g1~~TRINITY_DN2268_c0_g1_i1.p1  ORF type:complete len:462 (+),score=43.57 TRINITY_DN2268_c0_g1_i1:480-1865(+)